MMKEWAVSYGLDRGGHDGLDVAQKIGRPSASRAVGAAVGANPLAVLIPCHRVVGSNGQMTGFRWGLEMKMLLLKREGTAIPSAPSARGVQATKARSASQVSKVVGEENVSVALKPVERAHLTLLGNCSCGPTGYVLTAVFDNVDQLPG